MATKDFITYSPNTGNKKQTISVTASKNISSERNTVLSISAKGITKTINEEFYKLKYCSTVVYMVPRA